MPATAAPAHRPARSRPGALRLWARGRRFERRLGRRLAFGATPAQAATAEGVPETDVATLLADPAFAALVDAYRDLQALPEDAARERLRRLARALLDEMLIEGDVRAALFILREEGRGRDPADTLAAGVLASAAPPPPRPATPRTAPTAPDRRHPTDRAAWRAAEGMRAAVLAEHAALHRATVSAPATSPATAATSAAPARPAPNRRERRRLTALRRQAPPAPPPAVKPPGGRRPP